MSAATLQVRGKGKSAPGPPPLGMTCGKGPNKQMITTIGFYNPHT